MALSTIKLTGKSKARAQEFSELVKNNLIPLDCFLCGSPNETIDIFSTEDRYGFVYPTGMCLQCGNIQQAEYYSDEHVKIFYEVSIEIFMEVFHLRAYLIISIVEERRL